MSADITANSTAETSLSVMPLPVFMDALPLQGGGTSVRLALIQSKLSLFLLRRRRSLDRRQVEDIIGHRGAILGAQQRGVLDHLGHRAAGVIAGRIHAVVEEACDVLFLPGGVIAAPVAQTRPRGVGHPALAVRRRPAGEALARDDAAEEIAR